MTKIEQTAAVNLTEVEIGVLRSILYEYYRENEYLCEIEEAAHVEIEAKLANAEMQICGESNDE